MRVGVVSLIGRPNSGKSTLLNQLVGTKLSIVSDKPQTTRNRIIGVKQISGNPSGQIIFLDTPGIHRPLYRMNVRMVDLALEAISDVDILVIVLDASIPTGAGDRFVLEQIEQVTTPVVLALNKIDLITKSRLLPLIDWYQGKRDFISIVPISALTGDGIERLEKEILQILPEGEPLYPKDYLTDQPEHVMVSEIVREKLLKHTRAELPFSTAVVVDGFEEVDEREIIHVYCSIFVERNSQKRIVIGKGGALLKQIGTEAREELERFFATKVYLDLHVRVQAGWREDERILTQLGLIRH